MRRIVMLLVLLTCVVGPLSGCVVEEVRPPGPRAGAPWVPGHYYYGRWIPGHWA